MCNWGHLIDNIDKAREELKLLRKDIVNTDSGENDHNLRLLEANLDGIIKKNNIVLQIDRTLKEIDFLYKLVYDWVI